MFTYIITVALTRRQIFESSGRKAEIAVEEDDENRLKRLFEIRKLPISLLSKTQCQDIDDLQKTARDKYTSEYYRVLYNKIIEDFNEENYQPHTVGAFLIGCMKPTNLQEISEVNRGCSLLCTGSLPLPYELATKEKWGFCSQNVILCVSNKSKFADTVRASGDKTYLSKPLIPINNKDPDAFEFIPMVSINSSSKAILFVDFASYDEFPGFNYKEKAYLLHRLFISDIKLLSYSKDGSEYKDLLGGGKILRVHELKKRPEIPHEESSFSSSAIITKSSERIIAADEHVDLSWSHLTVLFSAFCVLAILVIFAFRVTKTTILRR